MLKKIEKELFSCLRCGFCLVFSRLGNYRRCPAYDVKGFESYGARGKIALARAIYDGTLKLDKSIAKRFFSCTDCLACQSNCFKFVDLQKVYREVKSELAKKGLIPEGLIKVNQSLKDTKNIFGKPENKRFDWIRSKPQLKEKADILYFVGCSSSYLRRRIAASTYKLLELGKVNFTLLKNEWCCGHPQIASGQIDAAKEFLDHNLEAIEKTGVQRVVFSCPGCLKAFKKDAGEILNTKVHFEALHISELLNELINKEKIRPKKLTEEVTYHDSCTLARHLEIIEQPRQLLASIPGLKLLEMPRHGKDTMCCGGGNLLKMVFPDLSDKIGAKRLEEAQGTGAEKIVTGCPACQTSFLAANYGKSKKTSVVDLTEIILKVVSKK